MAPRRRRRTIVQEKVVAVGQGEANEPRLRRRSLSDEVLVLPGKDLVVGVDVSEVLSSAGIALKPNASGLTFRTKSVSGFDLFLSHNWDTPRLHRYLGICLEVNFVRAAVSALVVLLLCICASTVGVLPVFESEVITGHRIVEGPSVTLLSVLAYWVVILFGRNITSAAPVTVFFDRACIDQSDAKRKEEGIHAIPEFVGVSDTMVSLATPLYFQKLWTMFEISLFLTLHPVEKLRVQPPSMAVTALLISSTLSVASVLFKVIQVNGYPIWCVRVLICSLILAWALTVRWWSSQLGSICRHAASLRIETAMCKEESDRRMVSEILTDFSRTQMIASPSDSNEVALFKFEAYMQQIVPKAILARVGVSGVSLEVIFSAWLPCLATGADRVGAAAKQVLASKAPTKVIWTAIARFTFVQSSMIIIVFLVSCIGTGIALNSFSESLPPRFWPSASVPALLIAILILYIVAAAKVVSLVPAILTRTSILIFVAFAAINSILIALMVSKRKP